MVEINISIIDLEEEAENEVYAFIDKYLRPLPKKNDGTIDKDAKGFQHNDVDALRHAYVSGVYTMEYNEKIASFLGLIREYSPWSSIGSSGPNREKARNMDLWNNQIGRKYGKKSKTRKELFQKLLILSREDFLARIKRGEYGDEYEIRMIEGKEIPTSKRDGSGNLG